MRRLCWSASFFFFFFFKQKTAYEMRISDWSSDVCSSDLFALHEPLPSENIAFSESLGRHLSSDVIALRDQPAAPLSAMDGYAIRFDDLPGPWAVVGESAAGAAPDRSVGPGEAMRIFTGALLPPDRKSTRLNSSHYCASRMPSS